ncbi:hypothetical protein D3218_01655 [Aureimonas flava]|uniref:Uncharacterized protein n=1 Tax=Aureimonas flava TaxID=2320271 RepID=A0A3A1WSC9_9HYPH|nr:hypothetical protein [Aureimonas flava]RIY03491.1 hypothetical protein D3218_01655 [Aureimonas flava]
MLSRALPQPARALDVLSAVPAGCVVHRERDDTNAPHIRAGESIIADPADCEPLRGELFLIEWSGGRRDVMQAVLRREPGIVQSDGSRAEQDMWTLTGLSFCLAEGPMSEAHLRSKIVSRVIGLYDPAFEARAECLPVALRPRETQPPT